MKDFIEIASILLEFNSSKNNIKKYKFRELMWNPDKTYIHLVEKFNSDERLNYLTIKTDNEFSIFVIDFDNNSFGCVYPKKLSKSLVIKFLKDYDNYKTSSHKGTCNP